MGVVILVVAYLLSKSSLADQEKLSPFECGFTAHVASRESFSMQFFLIALIFLVFDVELVLVFPALAQIYNLISSEQIFTLIWLLVGLSLGLLIEWSQQILNWVK